MDLNESQTRSQLINPQLGKAGWQLSDRSQVRFEIPVDGYDAEPWNGVTDYCLYNPSGDVLAVVEAKRCSRNARDADEQLRHYVTEISKHQLYAPFGFMANGSEIWFWEVGLSNPRMVAGFFSPDDLRRLLFLRQNRKPLEATAINTTISERPYQHEAIRPSGPASPTDPSTWGTFDQVMETYDAGLCDGIGFVFNGDGIVGINLENQNRSKNTDGQNQEAGSTFNDCGP